MLYTLIKLANIYEKLAGRWENYIHGEYWIDEYGQDTFADQDIGDVGHEMHAADAMLSKDILLEGLKEYIQNAPEEEYTEEDKITKLNELDDIYNSDELGASSIFFNEQIPDGVGAEAAGSMDKWKDIQQDIRFAYVKYHNAIHVINNSFSAWKIDENTIERIQNFIWERLSHLEENEMANIKEDVFIEEVNTHRSAEMPVGEFLQIKFPGELFRVSRGGS